MASTPDHIHVNATAHVDTEIPGVAPHLGSRVTGLELAVKHLDGRSVHADTVIDVAKRFARYQKDGD